MNTPFQGRLLDERCYAQVSPEVFIPMIVPSERCLVSLGSTDDEKGTCVELPVADVPDYVADKTNSYIYPASFFGKVPKTSLVDRISCFVVDLDDVADVALINLLDTIDKEEVKPQFLVSSGSGYHTYYVFPSFELRKRWKDKVQRLCSALYEHWTGLVGGCICDLACRSIPHGFRPVGSLSKDGKKVCQCWQISVDEMVDIHVLDAWLGQAVMRVVAKDESDKGLKQGDVIPIGRSLVYSNGETIDFNRLDPVENRNGTSSFIWDDRVFGKRHERLYYWTLEQAPIKTHVGHRFLTMFCLAGLGYACGIERSSVEEDLKRLVRDNWLNISNPVLLREVDAAMKGYCPDYATLHRETRERWLLGWNYGEAPKRRAVGKRKSRSEHITEVNQARWLDNQVKIAQCIALNPSITKMGVVEKLKARAPEGEKSPSRATVYRHWETAVQLARFYTVGSAIPRVRKMDAKQMRYGNEQ